MYYTSIKGLQGAIIDGLVDGAKGIVFNVAEQVIQESIKANVYGQNEGTDYSRTYQLYNIVTLTPVKIGNSHIRFDIYMDGSKLQGGVVEDSIFNQHLDVNGSNVGVYVPFWVEYGHGGLVSNQLGGQARHYMKSAVDTMRGDNKLVTAFATALRSKGFNVKLY